MSNDTAMDQTLQLYANPTMIQTVALDRLSEQVLGGEPVVDGNNVFTFLNEFNAQCTAGFATAVSNKLQALYPSRAQTFNDLYGHMSDWDYEGIYGYPSTTKIQVAFDRNFIITNAKPIEGNADYRKLVLPEFSTFTIGEYKFGIHYPIEIRVRLAYYQDDQGRSTGVVDYDACNITVQWDLSKNNPLCSYDTNVLEHRSFVSRGINLICIEIPVYQFVITTTIDDAISNTGYLKKFDYTDRFYVLRIYHKVNHQWVELNQSYSSIVYDPAIATAIVKVYPDLNQLKIDIPQVYFTNGLVGSQLRIDIYTTKGEMNVDISSYTKDQFGASFVTDDDRTADSTYSDMLKYVNVCIVSPIYTKITDGNNGIDLAELKRRVVDRTEKNILITADKISSYLAGRGFSARNYIDNVTSRWYLAEKTLVDSDSQVISAGSFNTVFTSEDLATTTDEDTNENIFVNHDTFKYVDQNSFMVLPSTIYEYSSTENSAHPVDNEFIKNMEAMTNEEKVNLLNSGIYSFSPFHMKVMISNTVPVATYYDLLYPEVKNISFSEENINTNTQISLYNSMITHLNNGSDGYVFDILLYKTDDLEDVDVKSAFTPNEDNIYVMLRTLLDDGNYAYMFGEYKGESDKHDWLRFTLNTNYAINAANRLQFTSFKSDTNIVRLGLTQEFELMFFVKREFCPAGTGRKPFGLPSMLDNYTWLTTQKVTLKFGEEIDTLMSNLYMETEDQVLKTYDTTVFAQYNQNLYARYTEADIGTEIPAEYQEAYGSGIVTTEMVGMIKYPLEISHEEGDVIISSDNINLTPLSYYLIKTENDSEQESLYLLSTNYTASASPFNEFCSAEYRVPHDPDIGKQHYRLDGKKITNYRIDYADVEAQNKLYIASDNKEEVIFYDGLQFICDELKHEDRCYGNIRELYTTASSDKSDVINPVRLQNFVYVEDITTIKEESTPEVDLKGVLGVTGAVYRTNPSIDITDYKEYTYRNEEGKQVPFTPEKLEEFYADVDSYNNESTVCSEWGVTPSAYKGLLKIRFPFIKVFTCDYAGGDYLRILQNYIDTLVITEDATDPNGVKISIVKEAQRAISNGVYTFETIDKLNNANLEDGKAFWVENVDDAELDVLFTLESGMDISTNEVRGVLGYRILITSGDVAEYKSVYLYCCGDKFRAVNFINAKNAFNGFVLLYKEDYIDDGTTKYNTYRYQFLSKTDKGTLDLDYKTVNWTTINKWPWELMDSTAIDYKTGRYVSDIVTYMNDATSVNIKHSAGSTMNESDIPIEDKNSWLRKITYNVTMLHLDYKLLMSEEVQHQKYRQDTVEAIRSYFATIIETRLRLLEGTNLFYSPIRTMGYAKFRGKNNEIIFTNLEVALGFRLHVESFISANSSTKSTIKQNILKIIDKHIASGTVSCVDIATEIQSSMSDMILHVDVLGINGDQSLQTLLRSDESTIPHLGYKLIMNDDGSIGIDRGLTLEYSIIR